MTEERIDWKVVIQILAMLICVFCCGFTAGHYVALRACFGG